MQKRSDRYRETSEPIEVERNSRVKKNHVLYDEINSKIGFEEITSFNSDNQINLSSLDMGNLKRSDYQRVKDYKDLLNSKEDVDDQVKEEVAIPKKNYDINKVLEEAKKNREIDELEGKRSLKGEDNVLNNLNKKYLHQKGFTEEDNEKLKELIDTITSKTLVDDVRDEEEKELLSELLATTIDVQLESELSDTQIIAITNSKDETNTELVDTNSFYSKSLELSGSDLLGDKEIEPGDEEEKDEKPIDIDDDRNVFKIIFISVILLAIVLVVGYFILQLLGVSIN